MGTLLLCLLLLVLTTSSVSSSDFVSSSSSSSSDLGNYIVHVSISDVPNAFPTPHDWYTSALTSVKTDLPHPSDCPQHCRPIYAYRKVFHGFAATLTHQQARALEKIPGVSAVFPDTPRELHTTHTPGFLGLAELASNLPSPITSFYGDDVIVGVIDTGVWPERTSFDDAGFGPVPSRWKGQCEVGPGFDSSNCNRKLIGARAYYKGYEAAHGPMDETSEFKSARDGEGHGTHTASTATGSFVANASLLGYAAGEARGMAPRSRLAVYKVCWESGCYDSDILAAFEAAVEDGVDVISLSVGGGVRPYSSDSIAIGSFGAIEEGIFVSCSAGNSGPTPQSASNIAPWIMTVAASTVDRDFPASVMLGDGTSHRGVSLSSSSDSDKLLPLVYAGNAALNGSTSAYLCIRGSLDPNLVAGKVVFCERGVNGRVEKGLVVKQAGGAGMILANDKASGEELIADSHLLPASLVGFKEGTSIKAYIQAAGPNALAKISLGGTKLGVKPAPVMAAFSSRGPNLLDPEILKPDITAPGVNILAAWTGAVGPSGQSGDNRDVEFNIISGTSMSCPHMSGLAALLKGVYPDWTPGAIKSALMTTASRTDNAGGDLLDGATSNVATPYAYGAGHVEPLAALDPGLVYDLGPQDYIDYLCTHGYYKSAQLSVFTKGRYQCSGTVPRSGDLNYPSFSLVFEGSSTTGASFTFARTATNVGPANSTYTVKVQAPEGVEISVDPEVLAFKETKERLSYQVTFKRVGNIASQSFGYLAWSNGQHVVTSPIAITKKNRYSIVDKDGRNILGGEKEGGSKWSVESI